MVWISELLV